MQNSGVSLLTAIITAVIVFFFGVAFATMKGAKKSYATAKGGVGSARKTYWSSIGGIIKMSFWVVVLVVALVMWQVHDVRSVDDSKPANAPAPSHSAGRR